MIRLARRILGGLRHRAVEQLRDWKERARSPYLEGAVPSSNARRPLLDKFPNCPIPESLRAKVIAAAELHAAGRFDLLGSGWTDGRMGGAPSGFPGFPAVDPIATPMRDPQGRWLSECLPRRLAEPSRRRWRLLPAWHEPIDWGRDFRSGFRWDLSTRYNRIRYGNVPGVDVKLPWELGRLQHLPVLAFAAHLDPSRGEYWASVLRAHWIDFVASNPPGQGVQWACTMDVAIRTANLCLSFDIARLAGWTPDPEFDDLVVRSIGEHAQWIRNHLEWHPWLRANHYLADLTGLLVACSWLPEQIESAAAFPWAAREFALECELQFHPDGSNFEASTAYHRLSSEMLAWGCAILLRRKFTPDVDEVLARRVAGAASLLDAIEAPDGGSTLVGDCDSGRFLRISPDWKEGPGEPEENPRDFRSTREMLRALVPGSGEPTKPISVHGELIRACSGKEFPIFGSRRTGIAKQDEDLRPMRFVQRMRIPIPGDLESGIEPWFFPGMGIAILRSPRLHLVFRCGELGQKGNGGHAHFDPLAIELWVDGIPRILDPGSFCYTSDPLRREAWRSSRAHWLPIPKDRGEPGRTDGLFRIVADWKPEWLAAESHLLVAQHSGWGELVRRTIRIVPGALLIQDESDLPLEPFPELNMGKPWVGPEVRYSPGYGISCPEFGI